MSNSLPVIWSIAGTDPTGGAGLATDLITIHTLGGYACTVITSVVAQNARGVEGIDHLSSQTLREQLEVLEQNIPPDAIKTGMLGRKEAVQEVAALFQRWESWVVCDPVLGSSSGTPLLELDALEPFKETILPHVSLLTPNLPEAAALLGRASIAMDEVEDAAEQLLEMGPASVLVKGGHAEREEATDYWTDGTEQVWLTLPRIETEKTRGTGCVLSSALATLLGMGFEIKDALVLAKAYIQQGLRTAPDITPGGGPLRLGDWPADPQDFPRLARRQDEISLREPFPDCGPEPLGLYPIVDRVEWLKKLLPLGIKTIQLRVKDLEGEARENELREGIEVARKFDTRLFINDAWELAVEHGAYGVHIGQDDLETADVEAIRRAGLRLGLSTHSYAEAARAWTYRPSYIALGTLFHTTSKAMDYEPLGLEAFRCIRNLVPVPVVAIGGLSLENAPMVRAAGADGMAVISEVKKAPDLAQKIAGWKTFWEQS